MTVILVYRAPSSWEMCSSACGVKLVVPEKKLGNFRDRGLSGFFYYIFNYLFVCVLRGRERERHTEGKALR